MALLFRYVLAVAYMSGICQGELQISHSKPASAVSLWRYQPHNKLQIYIRSTPSFYSKTFRSIQPGTVVEVDKEERLADTTFLRLANGRGWIFDRSVDGVMCVRVSKPAAQDVLHAQEKNAQTSRGAVPATKRARAATTTSSVVVSGSRHSAAPFHVQHATSAASSAITTTTSSQLLLTRQRAAKDGLGIGHCVKVLSTSDDEAKQYVGLTGVLSYDFGDTLPYFVEFAEGKAWWFHRGEIKRCDDQNMMVIPPRRWWLTAAKTGMPMPTKAKKGLVARAKILGKAYTSSSDDSEGTDSSWEQWAKEAIAASEGED